MSVSPREFDIGDDVNLIAEFRNSAGDFVDPSAVNFKVKDPAGVVTTYIYGTNAQLVKDAVGKYRVTIDANKTGFWYYKFWSTGVSGKAAKETVFRVRKTEFS